MVPTPDVQDVPLGDGPVEGQARHGVGKGERVLIVGDTSDVDGHLWGRNWHLEPRGSTPGAWAQPATFCRKQSPNFPVAG